MISEETIIEAGAARNCVNADADEGAKRYPKQSYGFQDDKRQSGGFLGDGFKHFLFLPPPGEMIQFD